MVVKSRNKNIPIFVLVGVGWVTNLRGQPKFMSTGKEYASVEVECWWVLILWSHGFHQLEGLDEYCVMLNDARVGGRCSSVWLSSFRLDLERISSFIVLPSSNRINFGLYFYREGHRLVKKLLFI